MGGIAWTEEEDQLLRQCMEQYGEGKWHRVPSLAGLNRCRKSCRLRWLNYLRPNIKRGKFTEDEVDLIIKLHNLLGNRWSLIASKLSGRTANDVKNYWNCHLSKRLNNNSNAHQVKNQIMTREVQEQPQNHVTITGPSNNVWGSNLEKNGTRSLLPIQYTEDGEGQLVHNSYSKIEEGSFSDDLAAMDFDYFNGARVTFGYDNINEWDDFILDMDFLS